MTVLIFLLILGALVFVHELGHFLVAKWNGIRVDEFAIGFPPRIASVTRGETTYALNAIPFGGYVKIFGENLEDLSESADAHRSFAKKARWRQALVLVAGVTFNLIFAWILISAGFMIGQPTPTSYTGFGEVTNPELVVLGALPESPAAEAGLQAGDVIAEIRTESGEQPAAVTDEAVSAFIGENPDETFLLSVERGQESLMLEATPRAGLVEDDLNQKILGVSFDMIGTLQLGPIEALAEGLVSTVELTGIIAVELGRFLGQAVTGQANLEQVTGPVGIVGLVGDASALGLVHLLSFTAIISIHLAIINMIPFPALDGGRLLFVIIEGVTRKQIPVKVFQYTNIIGFALLMLLMVVVTYNDILKLW